MFDAYMALYTAAAAIIGVLLIFCLIRAIKGPRIADRVIAVNMIGTCIVITLCILSFTMQEGYLTDMGMIYTMLSFLAVVLLTKVYIGLYREQKRAAQLAQQNAEKEDGENA